MVVRMGAGAAQGMSRSAADHHCVAARKERSYTLGIAAIATFCSVGAAGLFAGFAGLVVALLHGAPLVILTVGGGAFGAFLTLEIALAAFFVAVRR